MGARPLRSAGSSRRHVGSSPGRGRRGADPRPRRRPPSPANFTGRHPPPLCPSGRTHRTAPAPGPAPPRPGRLPPAPRPGSGPRPRRTLTAAAGQQQGQGGQRAQLPPQQLPATPPPPPLRRRRRGAHRGRSAPQRRAEPGAAAPPPPAPARLSGSGRGQRDGEGTALGTAEPKLHGRPRPSPRRRRHAGRAAGRERGGDPRRRARGCPGSPGGVPAGRRGVALLRRVPPAEPRHGCRSAPRSLSRPALPGGFRHRVRRAPLPAVKVFRLDKKKKNKNPAAPPLSPAGSPRRDAFAPLSPCGILTAGFGFLSATPLPTSRWVSGARPHPPGPEPFIPLPWL